MLNWLVKVRKLLRPGLNESNNEKTVVFCVKIRAFVQLSLLLMRFCWLYVRFSGAATTWPHFHLCLLRDRHSLFTKPQELLVRKHEASVI